MPHERRNPVEISVVSVWEDFLPSCGSFRFIRPPSPPAGRSVPCKQNQNQSKPFGKGRPCRLDYSPARQNAAVKDAQRGEAGSLTALRGCCCHHHDNYGGHTEDEKSVQFHSKENRPEATKKLRFARSVGAGAWRTGPSTVCAAFLSAEQQMGDVLDALTIEKV